MILSISGAARNIKLFLLSIILICQSFPKIMNNTLIYCIIYNILKLVVFEDKYRSNDTNPSIRTSKLLEKTNLDLFLKAVRFLKG